MYDIDLITSEYFASILSVNVFNDKLTDKDFRKFVINILGIVNFPLRNEFLKNEKQR
jgi:hypothetical protein